MNRLLSGQLLTLLLMHLYGVRVIEVVVGQDLSQNSAPPRRMGRPGGELHGTLTSLGPANGAHVLTHDGLAHRYQSTFHAPQNRCPTEALSKPLGRLGIGIGSAGRQKEFGRPYHALQIFATLSATIVP